MRISQKSNFVKNITRVNSLASLTDNYLFELDTFFSDFQKIHLNFYAAFTSTVKPQKFKVLGTTLLGISNYQQFKL